MAGFFDPMKESISKFGQMINAPVVFNWDTEAARQDARTGAVRNGQVKRSAQSVAGQSAINQTVNAPKVLGGFRIAAPGAVGAPNGAVSGDNNGDGIVDIYGNNDYNYDPAAVESARRIAADTERKTRLKGEGGRTIDELFALYDELTSEIKRVAGERTGQIHKEFDGKVDDQVTQMNEGMYDVDVAAASGNLADSSFRSFDRGKVRTAADSNIKTLNNARNSSVAEVGAMVAGDTADIEADRAGLNRSRTLLNESDDLSEIQTTANTLDTNKRSAQSKKARYATDGEFTQKANNIGKYDSTAIEQTLQSVIQNASATPATKQAAMNDLLNGTPLDAGEKERLKNKYSQSI